MSESPAEGVGDIDTQAGQLLASEPVLEDPPTQTVQVLTPIADLLVSEPAGPPVPATGLPEGWTMEQWNHYGAQWLIDNEPTPASTDTLDWDL